MQLTPQSTAACNAARDSVSSTLPHAPPIAHAPKLMSETFQPVRPKSREFISSKIARRRPRSRVGVADLPHLLQFQDEVALGIDREGRGEMAVLAAFDRSSTRL